MTGRPPVLLRDLRLDDGLHTRSFDLEAPLRDAPFPLRFFSY